MDIRMFCERYGIEMHRSGSTTKVRCILHDDSHPSAYFKEGWDHIFCPVCRKNIYPYHLLMSMGYGKAEAMDRSGYYHEPIKDIPVQNLLPEIRVKDIHKNLFVQFAKPECTDDCAESQEYVHQRIIPLQTDAFIDSVKEAYSLTRRKRIKRIKRLQLLENTFGVNYSKEIEKLEKPIKKGA